MTNSQPFHARISRVRLKAGGADVHVLENKRIAEGDEDYRGTVVANARSLATHATPEIPLVGYVIMGVYADGAYSFGHRWAKDGPIPRTLLPSYISEVVRRDMIVDGEARSVFSEMFEWVE